MNDDASSKKQVSNLRHGGPSQPGATGGRSTADAQEDLAEACRLLSSAADLCLAPHVPPDRSDIADVADVADFRVLSLGLGAQLIAAQILSFLPPAQNVDHTDNFGVNALDSEGFQGFEGEPAVAAKATRRTSAETAADRQVAVVDLVRAADALIRRHPVNDFPSGITAVIAAVGDLLSEVLR